MRISVVIPAHNEEKSIGKIVAECSPFSHEIIVIDDGSTDATAETATVHGAKVIKHDRKLGVTRAIESGFKAACGDIIVTLDADGQHSPSDIPRLIEPIVNERADLTMGVRSKIPHFSERTINALTNFRVRCRDGGTGFRAVRASLAKSMSLHGSCLCGTFILEAHRHNARIAEVPINVRPRVAGKRRIRTRHVKQFLYVLYYLLRTKR